MLTEGSNQMRLQRLFVFRDPLTLKEFPHLLLSPLSMFGEQYQSIGQGIIISPTHLFADLRLHWIYLRLGLSLCPNGGIFPPPICFELSSQFKDQEH